MGAGMTAVATTKDPFDVMAREVVARFHEQVARGAQLYTVPTAGLWEAYLNGFHTPQERSHHDCRECRKFIENYGGLVVISSSGGAHSALWDERKVPSMYRDSVLDMRQLVSDRCIGGVFYSNLPEFGSQDTFSWKHNHVWSHLRVTNPSPFKHALLFAHQGMAERAQDYEVLKQSLQDYPIDIARKAVALLSGNTLFRANTILPQAQTFLTLHELIEQFPQNRDNHIWKCVGTAPIGHTHVRSGMLGTLLEDLRRGTPMQELTRSWQAKMDPLQYQRAQAPPKAGNIRQAEDVVSRLQSAGAFRRRFARLEDVLEWYWKPQAQPAAHVHGTFSHLKPRQKPVVTTVVPGEQVSTWAKFQRDVLPGVVSMELKTGGPMDRSSYVALVTSVDPAAPLIFQWNHPVSWYGFAHGATAGMWGLTPGAWVPITCVTPTPNFWNSGRTPDGVVFILGGCRDQRSDLRGGGFFTESLKSEYHSIRSTLEAHQASQVVEGRDLATACGWYFSDKASQATIRVTLKTGLQYTYRIDRME